MLRRKPTRVEDRADVAEEYEAYVAARDESKRLQSTPSGAATHSEDVAMRDADTGTSMATAVALQQQQQQQRNATRSRIGLGQTRSDFEQLLSASYDEEPLHTLKLVAHIRDCRDGGKGERELGRWSLAWLANHHRRALTHNLKLYVATFGRFDDIEALVGTGAEHAALELLRTQLVQDLQTLTGGSHIDTTSTTTNATANAIGSGEQHSVSMCAKWIPSERKARVASSSSSQLRKKLCRHMKVSSQTLRKTYLTPLRQKLAIPERAMCANEWDDIDFDKVPRAAMAIYGKVFERRVGERFDVWKAMQLLPLNAQQSGVGSTAGVARSPLQHVLDVIESVRYSAITLPPSV